MKNLTTLVLCGAAVILIISIFAISSYNRSKKLQESNSLVVQSNKQLYQSEKVLSSLKDVETGTRGFFITGDSAFLKPYLTAKVTVPHAIDGLRNLTPDSRANKLIDSLRFVAQQKLQLCKQLQDIKASGKSDATSAEPILVASNNAMTEIRSIVSDLQIIENTDMQHSQVINEQNFKEQNSGMFLLLAAFFILLFVSLFAGQQLSRLRNTQDNALSGLKSRLIFFSKRIDDIVKGISDPFFALDGNFKIIYLNDAVRNGMGRHQGVLMGQNFFDKFARYDETQLGQKLRDTMYCRKPNSFEHYDHFLDRWYDVSIYPTSEGISAYLKDISRRKVYEKELDATRNLMEETSLVAMTGGWELEVETGELKWTAVTRLIYETDADYVPELKNNFRFYKEGSSRETIIRCINEAIETGKEWDCELQITTAKGNEKWVRSKGKPGIVNGECVTLYGTVQDVTEIHSANKKLADEKKLLKTIIDNIPANIYLKDLQSRKVLINTSELKFTGKLSETDVLGKSDFELYRVQNAEISVSEDQEVFSTRRSILHKQTIAIDSRGLERTFLTSKIPFINDNDEVAGLIGISYDITNEHIDILQC